MQWSVSCGGWAASCNSDVELQEQSQDPGDVPVALVGLATKLWQHKCQSPAEPLSLLALGFQQWKHLVRPAWSCEHGQCEASKSTCCTVHPIALHHDRPQILPLAFHSASVGQHHIDDLVQDVAGNVLCHSQGHCVQNWRDQENNLCTLGFALPGKYASQGQ